MYIFYAIFFITYWLSAMDAEHNPAVKKISEFIMVLKQQQRAAAGEDREINKIQEKIESLRLEVRKLLKRPLHEEQD